MARRTTLPKMTDRLDLGDGLRVSPLCLGMTGDPDTVSAAFDAGVNFFFCSADMHWPLYGAMRRGLEDLLARGGGVRDDIVVAAASYISYPTFFHAPFLELTSEIRGLERIDVTVAGGAVDGEFRARKEQSKAHRTMGARAFGASSHDRAFAAELISGREVDIGFFRFNALHRGALTDIFPRIRARRPTLSFAFKTALAFAPERFVASGLTARHWRPAPTDHYRYALLHDELDGLLCSPTEPEHVRAMSDALDAGPLSLLQVDYMADLADLLSGKARMKTGAAG